MAFVYSHFLQNAFQKYSQTHGGKSKVFENHKTRSRIFPSSEKQVEIPQNTYLPQMSAVQGAHPPQKAFGRTYLQMS